jgi:hypothetical protein
MERRIVMNNVIQQICTPYEEGRAALLATGSRTLFDLALDEQTKMRPLIEILRRALIEQYGLHVIEFSLAGGLETNLLRVQDQRDRNTIESILRTHGLQDLPADSNLTSRVIPGLYRLLRAPTDNLKWANGKQMRFAVVIHFSEHLVPALQNGSATEDMLRVGELIHQLAQSQSLRRSGNFVIFLGREQYIDELVRAPLYAVRLNQPDPEEKKKFLDEALKLYDKVTLEQGLTTEDVARLSANTPNASQECLLRASHRTGKPVSSIEIQREKVLAVQCMSEGTLTPLSSDRVKGIELKGVYRPQLIKHILRRLVVQL